MTDRIHIIMMGGTIDSIFDPAKDMVVVNDHTSIVSYLAEMIQPHIEFTHEILTMRDSREITDNTRADLAASIQKQPCERILVTHGTYTMPETATFLSQKLSPGKNTVVLTGSMYPMKGFAPSDAPFNLGFAIAACLLSMPGVYIAMNSKIFPAGSVHKHIAKGRFESA